MGDCAHNEASRVSIQTELKGLNDRSKNKQRMGPLAPVMGTLLLLFFAIFLLPLSLYMLFFNRVYFWVRNQDRIDPGPYYNFDRHRLAHLSFMDKLWCEYCEWANGTLQWTTDIVNEIERRYCPIKNKCDPHCGKAKRWREGFLSYDHHSDELSAYYRDRYPNEGPPAQGGGATGEGR